MRWVHVFEPPEELSFLRDGWFMQRRTRGGSKNNGYIERYVARASENTARIEVPAVASATARMIMELVKIVDERPKQATIV